MVDGVLVRKGQKAAAKCGRVMQTAAAKITEALNAQTALATQKLAVGVRQIVLAICAKQFTA
ncbi:hypothetical protein GCM10011613_35250 [Cellvibrio zantedeschiae]|uniref:Uncharacterized protein n=1 Tax=Cellvibrio zantedeschiae TaxID=1237077 RepID=A0ABQ3BEI1_9GAMM|nr:hypothetical protein GCM10011613_35250 [Cellvibrio zantedeschiae]